jgi:hypothetical protein
VEVTPAQPLGEHKGQLLIQRFVMKQINSGFFVYHSDLRADQLQKIQVASWQPHQRCFVRFEPCLLNLAIGKFSQFSLVVLGQLVKLEHQPASLDFPVVLLKNAV